MKYYFVSGLPRSGSTLLENILAQNPRFHATSTSGILDIMFGVRNNCSNLIEFKANPNDEALKRVLKGLLDNYYANVDKPVVFDKSRGWLAYIELIEELLGEKVKVIVPVRDLRDVVSSFEKLWRKNAPYRQFAQEQQNYFDWQTVDGRVRTWLDKSQPVGLAFNRIKDALQRGLGDRMLFVDFDDLTTNPEQTMKAVYDFLEEPYFKHNFDHVEQVTYENDEIHGIKDLHKIRNKVEPLKSDWETVIGKQHEGLAKSNFWRK